MSLVYQQEITTALEAVVELTNLHAPQIPADLPADPIPGSAILQGLLKGTVDPDAAELHEAMTTVLTNQKAWGNFVTKIRNQEDADEAEQEYDTFMRDNNVNDSMRMILYDTFMRV